MLDEWQIWHLWPVITCMAAWSMSTISPTDRYRGAFEDELDDGLTHFCGHDQQEGSCRPRGPALMLSQKWWPVSRWFAER